MKKNLLLALFATFAYHASAQLISFEEGIPLGITERGGKGISVSDDYYKEGRKSLKWEFDAHSVLDLRLQTPIPVKKETMQDYGIYLWIYNEKIQSDSIRFECYDAQGATTHTFSFRLFAKGWRACWIGFPHMDPVKQSDEICGIRLVAPQRKGSIYIDRITWPQKYVNRRATPDNQIPQNNSLEERDLWHWCLFWFWEQLPYDIPLPTQLSADQTEQLRLVENRLDRCFSLDDYGSSAIEDAYRVLDQVGIKRSKKGFVGAPLVAPDEQAKNGEINLTQIETMLTGLAVDVLRNNSKEALKKYEMVWDYAMDQGFAWGSGMGTNHHYGYKVRKIYSTAWLMRNHIYTLKNREEILATLRFWAALQETRKPCREKRDELLDSWHTLTEPKYIAAMMIQDDCQKYREMRGLGRWISTSLNYTPGTIGGIKVDGTTFHHGLFYPAYTTGALAHLGEYVHLTDGTDFEPTLEAKKVLKTALVSIRNYCNDYEWGIGISGRHPFRGGMEQGDIEAFGSLALAGDLSDEGNDIDMELAGDYLRLNKKNTPQAQRLKALGVKPSKAPAGFFVYNYGATGVHRRSGWMVTLRGYNTNVSTSEIYVRDNRYGRYQSYGSVQIFGQPSRKASGYDENGWDWNRLPGTTTIHLPWDLLDSPTPISCTDSKEEFAGSSNLEGRNGVFGIKLMEPDRKNYTPDFVARKSVFCFDNRLICLGSDINNSNRDYPTETTLFQSRFDEQHPLMVANRTVDNVGYAASLEADAGNPVLLRDGYDNYYCVREGRVKVQIAKQESRHEKKRVPTFGTFSAGWIDHGTAPKDAGYEYMVVIQPDKDDLKTISNDDLYTVIRKDHTAHIVKDNPSGIKGYVVFESLDLEQDDLFRHIDAETFVMSNRDGKTVKMSVCDPNLNLWEKTYTTPEPSEPIYKQILLHGKWGVDSPNERVKLEETDGMTILTVRCQHGQPVEFRLIEK